MLKRWVWVAVWAVLVLAGGAATLYLQREEDSSQERGPLRWEVSTPAAEEPSMCPSSGERVNCAFWERG
ncbi:hypothetical protein [Streptomyces sp. NPDC089799]|uniref:hypothetical protein n=1 Tax=Streptomyces sp. NPDC089799 TaxID=3155066 RepID=UPI00341BB1BB